MKLPEWCVEKLADSGIKPYPCFTMTYRDAQERMKAGVYNGMTLMGICK